MATTAPVVTFKKGPSRRPQQSRRRSTSPSAYEPSSEAGPSTSTVIRPTKKNISNPLVQGTKRRRDLNEDDFAGGLDELDYKADEGLSSSRGDVYATRDTDYDLGIEAGGEVKVEGKKIRLNEVGSSPSILGNMADKAAPPLLPIYQPTPGSFQPMNPHAHSTLSSQDGEIDDGLYHGASGYLKTINKRDTLIDKKMQTGPIRATTNIRTITLVDYQPDVCKDYKETGFCGYGDSCKFLHDRGDYLAGWQLDKLDPNGGVMPQEEDEIEEVPFACLICRKEFTEPVVTKCGHYFCMK